MSVDYDRALVTLYEGDPRLFLDDGDGSYLQFNGGQPVMDSGLENIVFISYFTRLEPVESPLGWWGNYLHDDTAVHIGSRFEAAMELPVTLSNLDVGRIEAENALAHMITSGLAAEIIVEVSNPRANVRQVITKIRRPDQSLQELLLTKNGVNWIYQATDPAHGRK